MKTLWIVGGGAEAVPGIIRARKMGLHVVVSDLNPDAPGFNVADDRVIASTYDLEATLKAAKVYHHTVRPVNGVISIGSDVPLTVAGLADALGLPGLTLDAARLASDKLAMKQRFMEEGIPVPWFNPVESLAHLKDLVNKRGWPLVLKPVDSRGARGVLKLDPKIDLGWAYRHALQFSPGRRVMVEEYLKGPQISTESVLLETSGYTPGFSDRNYEYLDRFAPYMIENGGQQPSGLSVRQQQSVAALAERAGRSLGIKTGIAKGDMILTATGPKVIEMAARLSGGWFSTDQIPLATGVDLIGAAIKLALGEAVPEQDLIPRYQKGVAIRYFFPEPGRVIEITNRDRFAGTPWVHRLGFFVKPGESLIVPVSNHTQRAGFVITEGSTREEAVERAVEVVGTIKIRTVPQLPSGRHVPG